MSPSKHLIDQYRETADKFIAGNIDLIVLDYVKIVVPILVFKELTEDQKQTLVDINFVSFVIGIVVAQSPLTELNKHRSKHNVGKCE